MGFSVAALPSVGSRHVTRKPQKYQPLASLPTTGPDPRLCLRQSPGPSGLRFLREQTGTDGKEPAGDGVPSADQRDPS